MRELTAKEQLQREKMLDRLRDRPRKPIDWDDVGTPHLYEDLSGKVEA